MRFPTMWYVRPTKPQISLRICKAPAISSRHDLKSIGTGNLYLGPLHIIDRILESVMIFKFPVTI